MPGGKQPEKSWRSIEASALLECFAINAIGPALVAKHVLPRMPRTGKAVIASLSARLGSISDKQLGSWYRYRASNAAINLQINTLSKMLADRRRDAICVALHSGAVESALSRPFQLSVARDRLFNPAFIAMLLLVVIDGLDPTRTAQLVDCDRTIAP